MDGSQNYRGNILGIRVSAINIDQAKDIIGSWIKSRTSNYVCITPAHSIMQGYRNPNIKKIFNSSGMTTPDGMAIVWLLRLQGFKHVDRVYGPDLMNTICQHSAIYGWRHYFYGGNVGVAERLSERLKNQYPGLIITGMYSPPFRELTPDEDQDIIGLINETQSDIVWIGIGSPKQEQWMYAHLGKINAPVLIGVGAAFDYLSGRLRQAPHWIQRSGFEWLYRLLHEPKRLWRRYAQYPMFVILVLMQLLRLKRFDEDHG